VLSLACLGFFLRSAATHWHAVAQVDWRAWTSVLAVAALGLYMATYGAAAMAWQASLRMLGVSARLHDLCRVLMLSQFGKYLPGNFAHHAGRVVLARRMGIGLESTVASVAIDMGILLVVAAICSLPALGLLVTLLQQHGMAFGFVLAIGAMGLVLFGFALVFSRRARRLASHPLRIARQVLVPANALFLARSGLAHAGGFLLGATALYLLCSAFAGSFSNVWLGVVGAYTASWLLGFVVVGAPAGIGIREVALMFGLAPLYGQQDALAAAAVLRIVTTVGEGLLFLSALVLSRRAGKPAE